MTRNWAFITRRWKTISFLGEHKHSVHSKHYTTIKWYLEQFLKHIRVIMGVPSLALMLLGLPWTVAGGLIFIWTWGKWSKHLMQILSMKFSGPGRGFMWQNRHHFCLLFSGLWVVVFGVQGMGASFLSCHFHFSILPNMMCISKWTGWPN